MKYLMYLSVILFSLTSCNNENQENDLSASIPDNINRSSDPGHNPNGLMSFEENEITFFEVKMHELVGAMTDSQNVILKDFHGKSARFVFSTKGKRYTFYFENIEKPTDERVSIWVRPEGTNSRRDLLNTGNTLGLYHEKPNFGNNGIKTEHYYIAGGPFGMLTSDLHLSKKYTDLYQESIENALDHFGVDRTQSMVSIGF
ncbi:MAG: hypothetical protein MRY57_02040 [Candidatus Pacebacteria bacterium]|nr:hypothetical protein [Candidatus Paceibacterota bacterium]